MISVLATIITLVFTLLRWAIIIRALLSWLPMAGVQIDPYNPAIQALHSITDPILEPLRRFGTVGMMDLSPLIAIFGLWMIESVLLVTLGVTPHGIFF
jgi:YggT family protein